MSESGAALANKFMSFKSGSGLSSAVILRNIEDDGATPFATADRTSATIGYTASKDKALRLIPLLATTCTFEKWDVRDALKDVKLEVDEANASAQSVLSESIYSAAYGAQSAMGKSYYSTSATAASVQSFREKAYVLHGAVLSATGIADHESFVKAVEEGLSESVAGSPAPAVAPSTFLGGEARVHAPAGYTHLALAFDVAGKSPLMNVVSKCISLANAEAGLSGFTADSLVGVYGGSSPAEAAAVTDKLVAAITSTPSADIVARAKTLAKAEAVFAMDGGSFALANAMTASIMETNTFSGAAGVAASYDSITAQDVAAAFESMAKSSPAMAAVGDLSSTPYQGSIAAKFG